MQICVVVKDSQRTTMWLYLKFKRQRFDISSIFSKPLSTSIHCKTDCVGRAKDSNRITFSSIQGCQKDFCKTCHFSCYFCTLALSQYPLETLYMCALRKLIFSHVSVDQKYAVELRGLLRGLQLLTERLTTS